MATTTVDMDDDPPSKVESNQEDGENGGLNGLTEAEEKSVELFLDHVNGWRLSRGYRPLPFEQAVKFLMARKFDVDRALVLYQQHELMRVREGLVDLDPDDLKEELETGKFTIIPARDGKGASLALFHAHKHDPSIVSQQTTLKGVVYQLDVALEDVKTQRGGLVFIYNMTGSKYSNFDYELSQKMLTLLKGCYPARLKKVLIVMAPLWFKAPFKVLRLFVREKLRDRVFTVSIPQLVSHIPVESIPEEMGGRLTCDHDSWLRHCHLKAKAVAASAASTAAIEPSIEQLETLPTKARSHELVKLNGGGGRGRDNSSHNNHHTEEKRAVDDEAELENDEKKISTSSLSNVVSSEDDESAAEHLVDQGGMNLLEFIKHVRVKSRRGLYDEYSEIRSRPPTGTFNASRQLINQSKNRYTDVLCYDHSRVRLKTEVDDSDYINANFVDGYKQPKAFISTQGPMERTFAAFWQMIWEQEVRVVVMTTKTVERHRTKCGQYWPEDCGAPSINCGNFEIRSQEITNFEDYIVTNLILRNTSNNESRLIFHFQFVSWPDYGVPESAHSMLRFLQRVREKQAELTAQIPNYSEQPLGPPMVVHCSAGIGRTGTFATLDSAIRKFEDIGKVDIRSTVERIRAQRAFSIQMPDQYVFCHLAFLEYVLHMEYVDEIDLTGFDDDDCESD